MALTLALMTACAAVFGGLALTAFAADTGTTETTDTSTLFTAAAENQTLNLPPGGMQMAMGEQSFERGHSRAGGMGGGMGGMD